MKSTDKEQAVVYARYSSHSQGEQSIEGQLAAAKTYAEAKGYTIIHEYVDRAMTGRNDNRDEFQKMLSDCAKKQFTVIIVWKVDRFGRNREEITFNKYRAKKCGVRVEYVAETITEGPEGVILESVLEGMAEYYSLQLSQNVKRGFLESAKKCQHAGGGIPLGYMLDENKHFSINPDTAPIIKIIFTMYASGKSIAEIVRYLNDRGFKTSRKNTFSKNSLNAILKNEKYTGVYIFKDKIRVDGGMPAIIDRELFNTVQEMLIANQKAGARKRDVTDYILTGKLYCGHCGAMMIGECGTGKSGRIYNYYKCTEQKHRRACDKKPVARDLIESLVLKKVQSIVEDEDLLQFIADKTWGYYMEQDADREEILLLQKQLTEIEKSIANLTKAIEAGLLNDSIKLRMEELEQEKTSIKALIVEQELSQGFKLTKDHILYFLDQFKKMDYTDRECQRRLLETFVNAIYLYDEHLIIAFNYGDKKDSISFQEINDIADNERTVECSTAAQFTPLCRERFGTHAMPLFFAFFRQCLSNLAIFFSCSRTYFCTIIDKKDIQPPLRP